MTDTYEPTQVVRVRTELDLKDGPHYKWQVASQVVKLHTELLDVYGGMRWRMRRLGRANMLEVQMSCSSTGTVLAPQALAAAGMLCTLLRDGGALSGDAMWEISGSDSTWRPIYSKVYEADVTREHYWRGILGGFRFHTDMNAPPVSLDG